MRRRTLPAVALLLATVLSGQVKPAESSEIPPDTVVAVLNGRKYTADEIRRIVEASPVPQAKLLFERNPMDFLRAQAVLQAYSDLALKAGLEKQSPTKDLLEFYRLFVLSNAALNFQRSQMEVRPEDQESWYKEHSQDFREVRVRMIYFPFSDGLSEAAAKAKAEEIAKQARSGSDFVQLAKTNSGGDRTGAGADFTVRSDSKQPPQHMKEILLKSNAGTITDPLRHENGYYVFRVESIETLPYSKVKDEIFTKIQDARFRDWQTEVQSKVTIQIQNEAFFKNSAHQ